MRRKANHTCLSFGIPTYVDSVYINDTDLLTIKPIVVRRVFDLPDVHMMLSLTDGEMTSCKECSVGKWANYETDNQCSD